MAACSKFLCHRLVPGRKEQAVKFGLPVVLLFFVGAFRFGRCHVFPVGFVGHKKGKPEAAGKPHQPGLQNQQEKGIGSDPDQEAAVLKRKADGEKPKKKTDEGDDNADEITHIPGTVIKANFNVGGLSANRAVFVHLQVIFQAQAEVVPEELSLPAAGAPATKNGAQVTAVWSFNGGHHR